MTIQFDFDDIEGNATRAVVHGAVTPQHEFWFRPHFGAPAIDLGTTLLAAQPGTFDGKTRGTVQSPVVMTRPGRYVIHVQVEDIAGHRSNVLTAAFIADAPWPGRSRTRECLEAG